MKILKTYFLISCITVITISARSQTVPNITDSRLDFSLPDMKGDSLQLSSLKGKVFLLDFWASWCVPCRFSNKNLVKLYSKYKSNGFEILSVSLDDNKHDWMKAVNKDKITWLQIPASFLIDKNGNVVAINAEKKELENKIRELLGL
jgi:glutathione peroxidase-family protein